MRKLVISVFLMLLVAGSAFAQLDFEAKSFYAQGMLTLPSGDWGDAAGTGFGGGVGMTVPYSELLSFRGEISYVMYAGKDFGDYEFSYSMIPVAVLGQYRMKAEDQYFLLGGLGMTSVKFDAEYTGEVIEGFESFYGGDYDYSSTEFTLILGGGFDLNEQVALEGRFNMVSDANFLSVHGTYAF